jgi:hypothetical protein
MRLGILLTISVGLVAAPAFAEGQSAPEDTIMVGAKWDNVLRTSETVPTTQHLANAFTLRTSPLNKKLLKDLRDLHTNDTRLQLWYSVPNQAVAELKEPTATETFWDFRYIDPVVVDFFANTTGKRHINIGTIPRWMFKVPPVEVPTDPGASFYQYVEGTKGELLKDPSGKQFADFQARLFQWYTQGGFTDETGKYHKSGYHYKIDYWGIMNESALENKLTVEQYTVLYDAVAVAIRKIDPNVQFMGPEVTGSPSDILAWERYFLNPNNHAPSVLPLQWFSFHNYVIATNDPATWQAKYFANKSSNGKGFGAPALGLIDLLRDVIEVRDELSPDTKIAIDELGTFQAPRRMSSTTPEDAGVRDNDPYNAYNPLYWVASGGNFAASYVTAENLGIQLISMTQMVGAPTQSEPCSMIDWDTAQPNAHYRVLQLINSNFGQGDKLVDTQSSSTGVIAQASVTSEGRKVLLVNTSNRTVSVNLADAFRGSALKVEVVDEASGEQAPREERATDTSVNLAPFAVAVVAAGK